MSKLIFLDSQNIFGTMNAGSVSLHNLTSNDKKLLMDVHNLSMEQLNPSFSDPYQITPSDKQMIFKMHRKLFAEANGFDWHKMFMLDQNKKDLSGNPDLSSTFEMTKEYVESNPNGWTDIPEYIFLMNPEVDGVAIGHPVADCPVITVQDQKSGRVALAHCSADLIDKYLPTMIVETLLREGSKVRDLLVNVAPFAGNDWTYDRMPGWATDEQLWRDAIVLNEDTGLYHIDLMSALDKQFSRLGLAGNQVIYSPNDTILDPRYYSNSQARENPSKGGRQFEGVVFQKTR